MPDEADPPSKSDRRPKSDPPLESNLRPASDRWSDADLLGGSGSPRRPGRAGPSPRAEGAGAEGARTPGTRAEGARTAGTRAGGEQAEQELPEPRNSSDSGFVSGSAGATDQADPADRTTQAPEHDKQGLDLARSVAGRLKGMTNGGPAKPVRRTRRRRSVDPNISGARPDDRDPQLLTSAIGRLLRDQGWEVDVAVHGVMARWPSIVGAEMAQHCVPESYTDTELLVRTDSTAWATQVRLLAPELVRRLNAVLGDGTVTRVTVQGPNAPSWRKGPRTVRGGRGPRDTYG